MTDTKLYGEVMTICANRLAHRKRIDYTALARAIMAACDKNEGANAETIADAVISGKDDDRSADMG